MLKDGPDHRKTNDDFLNNDWAISESFWHLVVFLVCHDLQPSRHRLVEHTHKRRTITLALEMLRRSQPHIFFFSIYTARVLYEQCSMPHASGSSQKPDLTKSFNSNGSCFAAVPTFLPCRAAQHVEQTLKRCSPHLSSLAKQHSGWHPGHTIRPHPAHTRLARHLCAQQCWHQYERGILQHWHRSLQDLVNAIAAGLQGPGLARFKVQTSMPRANHTSEIPSTKPISFMVACIRLSERGREIRSQRLNAR